MTYETLNIKDFNPQRYAEGDYLLMVTHTGESGKLLVADLRSELEEGVMPGIDDDGYWTIGGTPVVDSDGQKVTAKPGKPIFRLEGSVLMWKYAEEPSSAWRVLGSLDSLGVTKESVEDVLTGLITTHTHDYERLKNLPRVNGKPLVGDVKIETETYWYNSN